MVKDFWATPNTPSCSTSNHNIYPYVVGDKGTAQEALDKLAATFKSLTATGD